MSTQVFDDADITGYPKGIIVKLYVYSRCSTLIIKAIESIAKVESFHCIDIGDVKNIDDSISSCHGEKENDCMLIDMHVPDFEFFSSQYFFSMIYRCRIILMPDRFCLPLACYLKNYHANISVLPPSNSIEILKKNFQGIEWLPPNGMALSRSKVNIINDLLSEVSTAVSARKMGVSRKTVCSHRNVAFSKMGIKSKEDMLAKFFS